MFNCGFIFCLTIGFVLSPLRFTAAAANRFLFFSLFACLAFDATRENRLVTNNRKEHVLSSCQQS